MIKMNQGKEKGKMKTSKTYRIIAMLITILLLSAAVLTGCGGSGGSGGKVDDMDGVMRDAAEYLVENVEVDAIDAMGGGWIPFALKMSGTDAADDDYYAAYFDSVRAVAKSQKGVLSEDHPTAYERVSINLKAMGEDPTNVEGYDLLEKVDDYELIKEQGLNAEIYALISANYCGYELKSEDKYLYDIFANQMPDGAFGMDQDHPDADMTAMAVQALAYYDGKAEGGKSDERAQGAIDRALEWLATKQDEDGGYGSCEADAQVMIAISCLGHDVTSEDDYVIDCTALYADLMSYKTDKGFSHIKGDEVDIMATEQALMALDAVKMAKEGQRMFV